MRIFALETSKEKLKKKYRTTNEHEIMTVYYHGFRFLFPLLLQTGATFLLITVGVAINIYIELPVLWVSLAVFFIWLIAIVPHTLNTMINWFYDFFFVTEDKIVVINQSSLFHQHVTQMNLENIASVSAETQFWNLFGFGKLHIDLKEGVGEALILPYIPRAEEVAAKIAETVTLFQRRP